MLLKRKTALSFFISASIIAILVGFEYVSFVKIRNEIHLLEITDTIRSESLQLRRHEKNFFLYPLKAEEESEAVFKRIGVLKSILNDKLPRDHTGRFSRLQIYIQEYEQRFKRIQDSIKDLSSEFESIKASYTDYAKFFPIIELTFLEHPLVGLAFMEKIFLLPPGHRLIAGLKDLDSEINLLRKNGEDIINTSQEMDKVARASVDHTISISQMAIVVFFSLFLVIGIGTLFFISRSVVDRLKFLTDVVEKTGKGDFSQVKVPSQKWGGDEVGVLIGEFNAMGIKLLQREDELRRKNAELYQSRKLAAIGTLASGVAHELNNPLNNIYISVQRLVMEIGDGYPMIIKESIDDILSQTIRVKRIVGDILEFARGRDPQFREMELNAVISRAYELLGGSVNVEKINFSMDSEPDGVLISADPEQMERVMVNLFSNAVDAMPGGGDLKVKVKTRKDRVEMTVSDTGKGMSAETIDKIYDPFFTTKDKGTGLGLAIVFNIIKKHHGVILVQSEEGKGTTFMITLPKGKG